MIENTEKLLQKVRTENLIYAVKGIIHHQYEHHDEWIVKAYKNESDAPAVVEQLHAYIKRLVSINTLFDGQNIEANKLRAEIEGEIIAIDPDSPVKTEWIDGNEITLKYSITPICMAPSDEKPRETTAREMVKAWLKSNCFDGLYIDGECGCNLKDLMPCDCEGVGSCEAGYITIDPSGEWDFLIGPDKDGAKHES